MICQAQFITHAEPANSPEVRALVSVVLRSLLSALWDLRVRQAVILGNTDFAVSQATSPATIVHKLAFLSVLWQQHSSQGVACAADCLQAHGTHGMGT